MKRLLACAALAVVLVPAAWSYQGSRHDDINHAITFSQEAMSELDVWSTQEAMMCMAEDAALSSAFRGFPVSNVPKIRRGKREIQAFNARTCGAFITTGGELGPWGQTVSEELSKRPDLFLGEEIAGIDGPPKTCERWSSFSTTERIHFWVWAFMSLAMTESACDPKIKGNPDENPNGTPFGLFQLERGSVARSQRRDPVCFEGLRKNGGPVDPHQNIRCAISIMTKQLDYTLGKRGKPHFFVKGSYWQGLTKGGTKATESVVFKRMRLYEPCRYP